MVSLDNFQLQFNNIKDQLYSHLNYPYVVKHINQPYIDDNKLRLLMTMMLQQNVKDDLMDKYIITTMLIQIALDTHESVGNTSYDKTETGLFRKRQLTVLGGIYYSSLYYKILADLENIELTHDLADAIKVINEEKMFIYHQGAAHISSLMTSVKKIETALFTKLANYIGLKKWYDFITNLLLISRLKKEVLNLQNNCTNPFLQNLQIIVLNKDFKQVAELTEEEKQLLVDSCNEQIALTTKQLAKSITKLNLNSFVKQQLILEKVI